MTFEGAFQKTGLREGMNMDPVISRGARKISTIVDIKNFLFAGTRELERPVVELLFRFAEFYLVRENVVMKFFENRVGPKNVVKVELVRIGHQNQPEAAAAQVSDQRADFAVFLKNVVPDGLELVITQL